MSQTAVNTKDDAVESTVTPPRKLPVINPELASVNYAGAVIKELFVRAPVDFIADDLKEKSIWKRIQANPTLALRKMDRVIIVSHDESMLWTAFCSESGPSWANISKPVRHELKSRHGNYYSDENYRIEWSGANFVVIRRKDNRTMPGGYATEQAAIKALNDEYPKPV